MDRPPADSASRRAGIALTFRSSQMVESRGGACGRRGSTKSPAARSVRGFASRLGGFTGELLASGGIRGQGCRVGRVGHKQRLPGRLTHGAGSSHDTIVASQVMNGARCAEPLPRHEGRPGYPAHPRPPPAWNPPRPTGARAPAILRALRCPPERTLFPAPWPSPSANAPRGAAVRHALRQATSHSGPTQAVCGPWKGRTHELEDLRAGAGVGGRSGVW